MSIKAKKGLVKRYYAEVIGNGNKKERDKVVERRIR